MVGESISCYLGCYKFFTKCNNGYSWLCVGMQYTYALSYVWLFALLCRAKTKSKNNRQIETGMILLVLIVIITLAQNAFKRK